MTRVLSAPEVLDRYFLEARSKLLDVAAILDRIDRGGKFGGDTKLEKIRQALALLREPGADRAERIQQIFSLAYDPHWERPARGGR